MGKRKVTPETKITVSGRGGGTMNLKDRYSSSRLEVRALYVTVVVAITIGLVVLACVYIPYFGLCLAGLFGISLILGMLWFCVLMIMESF